MYFCVDVLVDGHTAETCCMIKNAAVFAFFYLFW